jgi:hypothetical protein
MGFAGIDQRISCSVDTKGGVTVWVRYGGEIWDIIAEFDVIPVRDLSGNYFCLLCHDMNPFTERFSSRLELVIRHAWEPFLDWLNSTCSPSNWICLQGKVDSYSVATVKAEHEVAQERLKDDYCDAFPVISQRVAVCVRPIQHTPYETEHKFDDRGGDNE